MRRCPLTRARAALFGLAILASGAPAAARDVTLAATGEAALAQPMVVLGIGDDRAAARGSRDDLEDLLAGLPALAVLDTGASGHVLSHATAARFEVEAERGSRYVEAGMSGEHAMAVSRAVTLTVGDVEPEDPDDTPRGRRRPRATPVRLASQRLLLNEAPSDLASALLSPGSMVDVIGMPLILRHVIEIVPGASTLPALTVRLGSGAASHGMDAWVPLALVDYNRRHPANRGPLPSLATNPVVEDVTAELGAAEADGDWLLDTGAACSMISTAIARELGLVDADGRSSRRVDFTLPVGGVGGGHESLRGFRLDRLVLTASDGHRLVFPDPAVVVRDVSTIGPDGTKITLDGILGMNLLLPSGSGMTTLGAATQLPGPFERVVIDVPGERLGLALRR
jgi:hypothetical protein